MAARVRPGPAHARSRRPDLEGHVRPAGRRVLLQGRHRPQLDRELRRRRGARAAPTSGSTTQEVRSPSTTTTGRTGSRTTCSATIITAPGSAQSELGLPGGLVARLHAARGCRTPTATARGRGRRPRSPPVRTRSRSPMTCRGTRTTAPAALPAARNIAYTVPADGVRVTFSYVLSTHVLTVTTSRAGPVPDLDQQKAHWLERGILAWDLPAEASGWSFRLARRPDRRAGRRRGGDPRRRVVPDDARSRTGSPTTCASSGRTWPRTTRCGCRANAVRQVCRSAHRSARGRRLRRPRAARRRHRRSDPGRPRRRLRRRLRPRPRGDLAGQHAQVGGVGADGQGRRPARARRGCQRPTRVSRCVAMPTVSGR